MITPTIQAWLDGIKACLNGEASDTNPHKDFAMAHEWLHGWFLVDSIIGSKKESTRVQS